MASREKLATGISRVIGKYAAGIEGLAELESMQNQFEQIHEEDVLSKKQAARVLIKRECEISKEIMDGTEDEDMSEEEDEDGPSLGAEEGEDDDEDAGSQCTGFHA